MDPSLMIEKTLTDTDICWKGRLRLPKLIINNIVKKMGVVIPQNGIQVEIQDCDKSNWVNFGHNNTIGNGWNNMRNARGLKRGDVIRLYWKDTKFIFSMPSLLLFLFL
ncbi:hypothetical protein EUTSA_v10023005mg [Eutrema salsugineum]|uniref:TF-B3 domain-containing protein n=1 Tax=Eutrema salsugineum TaxID=72664 RepID=V4NVD4_EUTSA|nr:B3 domain-containing protein At1g08985 [Eutrema salsugineum]ESQ50776.1 hypothetical protein EUTSA_v10023005mg [Eutrema salsugineum]